LLHQAEYNDFSRYHTRLVEGFDRDYDNYSFSAKSNSFCLTSYDREGHVSLVHVLYVNILDGHVRIRIVNRYYHFLDVSFVNVHHRAFSKQNEAKQEKYTYIQWIRFAFVYYLPCLVHHRQHESWRHHRHS
jgi:hypothetical protein